MLQLTKLRKELGFNRQMGNIINVLKAVASVEFMRLQNARRQMDEFGQHLQDFFKMIDIAGIRHLFLADSDIPAGLVVITSDSGFLGKLNVSVVEQALTQYKKYERLIVIGKQGAQYLEEKNLRFSAFAGISDEVNFKETQKLTAFIAKNFLNKRLGRIIVIYPHFISFAVWQVQFYQLLPCGFLFPETRKPSVTDYNEKEKVILEPTSQQVIEELVKVWISYILYGIFWESKLSEWTARVMHLERSFDEIKRMDKRLHLQYFRRLHETSDKNIREILASKLATQQGR